MWYFLIVIVVFSNSVFSNANDFPNVFCCTECSCNITESGSCSLQFQEECNNVTCSFLNFKNESSIIELVVSVEHLLNSTNFTKSASVAATDGEIKLDISEFDKDIKEYVLLETRYLHVNESNIRNETSYMTRTSNARICVSYTTEWPLYNMEFSFKEFKYHRYKPNVEDPLNASGEIMDNYLPNSVRLYRLPKDPSRKWKGIEITIQDLEIDIEKGEYLLIGAGSSEDFPPRFVTHITESSSFYVANASAYIELVSGSTVQKDKSFKILWNRKDAEMPPTINPVDILNSVLICFYNYSEAKKEFEGKTNEEMFPEFREAFAESARKYLKENNDEVDCLDKSSVKLIGHHTKVKSSNALSILLKLGCEDRTFRYQELQMITKYFEEHDENQILGYKVGRCPDVYQDMPYKEKWSILIYALVPAFGLFILIVWAWKKNIFSQKCSPEKKENLTFVLESNSVPVQPNTYEATIPKVRIEDGQGRRQTLIQGTSLEDTEKGESDDVTAVEMDAIPSTSQEPDTLTRVLTNRKNKRRPSIQSLIPKQQECTGKSDVRKTEGYESEHLYDSVSSSKLMNETQL